MENIKELNWSWYQIRVPPANLHYFNRNFTDGNDIVFCHLNEIEPLFLAEREHELDEDDDIVLDPRNGSHISSVTIENTKLNTGSKKPDIFLHFPTKSLLCREEHNSCLRVLNARQNKFEASPEDWKKYSETVQKRSTEEKLFKDFLKAHFAANFREMYESGKEICQQYQEFLTEMVQNLLHRPDKFYTLQTALPVYYDSAEICSIIQSKIVTATGLVPLLEEGSGRLFNVKSRQRELQEIILDSIRHNRNVPEETGLEQMGAFDVILPEETLVVLLNTFSNDVNCCEIPVKIEYKNGSDMYTEEKLIKFSEPLPQRIFNLNNASSMYDRFLEYHVKLMKQSKWLNLSDGSIEIQDNGKETGEELFAVDLNQIYKPLPINDYMEKVNNSKNSINSELFSQKNMVVIEWNLASKQCDRKPLNILTKRKIPFCARIGNDCKLLNTSFKLEYKSSFGSETMAKGDLISEWIKHSITPDSYTERVRLDAKTFEPIIRQNLTPADIEDELLRLYQLKPTVLLTSLHGFLSTLANFPPGEYLLRYDMKFRDQSKIMVYCQVSAPKCTENVLSIHRMYTDAGIINCTNEAEFVPIDNSVVMPMHTYYSILPSCFPHWGTKKQIGFNDKTNILKKIEDEKKKKETHLKHLKNLATKRRRKVKAEKKKKKAKNKLKNEMEVEGFPFIEEGNSDRLSEIVANSKAEKEVQVQEQQYTEFNLEQYLADAHASISNTSDEHHPENKFTGESKRQLRPRKR